MQNSGHLFSPSQMPGAYVAWSIIVAISKELSIIQQAFSELDLFLYNIVLTNFQSDGSFL